MTLARDDNPESAEIVLETENGVTIERFVSYQFDSNFLTPTDGFRFTYAPGDTRAETVQRVLADFQIGTEVRLKIDGKIQGVGHIDSVDLHGSKHTGLEVEIEGRTKIAYAVDSCVDPGTVFAKETTIEDFVRKLYEPFGFTKITVSNDEGRKKATGKIKTKAPTTGSSKKKRRSKKAVNPLSKYLLDTQLKPYPGESVHAFASRVCQRHGLWIWCDAAGGLVVSRPEFDQASLYVLQRKSGGEGNNVVSGGVRRSGQDQPTAIFAACQAGSTPDFLRSTRKLAIINPVAGDTSELYAKYAGKGVRFLETSPVSLSTFAVKFTRPVFLYDHDSRTEEQLEAFLRRELALRLRKALTATYTVAGHVSSGSVWNVDTNAIVDDEWAGLFDALWILSRSFTKDRAGGTMTRLELIQRDALEFA